jgi:hypothetical protein
VITGHQHSDDHLRVRASTCSDTPPASIAGRSKHPERGEDQQAKRVTRATAVIRRRESPSRR